MPLFTLIAIDSPDGLERRLARRPMHLKHLKSLGDHIRAAGPFTTEDGTPCGSMLIIEADSLKQAEVMVAADPYVEAGVFESITVRPWKHIVGAGLTAESLK